MKKLNLITAGSLTAILAVIVASCSAKVESPQSFPEGNAPQGESQGPFTIAFDTNNSYSHFLKININQTEGKVEYKINTSSRFDLIVDEVSSAVTGCDATTVKHDVFWLPDESSTAQGQMLKVNSKFMTGRKTTGVLVHSFKNLQTCTGIEIKTRLRKEIKPTKIGQICEGFGSVDQCKLASYCKEKFVGAPFYEFEIWNQQGILSAKKYLVRSDGTRGLMSLYTVNFNDTTAQASFDSTANNNFSLKINNISYDGLATEIVNGQNYSLSLACEL